MAGANEHEKQKDATIKPRDMKPQVTNYVAISVLLLIGASALAFFVHPAWGVVPAAIIVLCAWAGWGMWQQARSGKNEIKQPAHENGMEQEEEDSDDDRVLVLVDYNKTSQKFYLDGSGKIVHVLGVSGDKNVATIGFVFAELWERDPVRLLEHISKRSDIRVDTISFVFSHDNASNPVVTGTIGATSGTMEESRFIGFFVECAQSFTAAWAQRAWGDCNAVRDGLALFLLMEAEKESKMLIEQVLLDPDGPNKDMEELASRRIEEQAPVFAKVEEVAIVTLLRAVPANTAWKCMGPLPPKIRLQLAESVCAATFPDRQQCQEALEAYRRQQR